MSVEVSVDVIVVVFAAATAGVSVEWFVETTAGVSAE